VLIEGSHKTPSGDDLGCGEGAERGVGNPHVARIRRGDAVAFYNYKDDGSGRLDWRALHTGLPTTEEDGVKWIANHWFRLNSLNEGC